MQAAYHDNLEAAQWVFSQLPIEEKANQLKHKNEQKYNIIHIVVLQNKISSLKWLRDQLGPSFITECQEPNNKGITAVNTVAFKSNNRRTRKQYSSIFALLKEEGIKITLPSRQEKGRNSQEKGDEGGHVR